MIIIRNMFDGGILQVAQNLHDTPVCFDNIFFPNFGCISLSYDHRIEHMVDFSKNEVDMKSLWNHYHLIDDEILEENHILNYLEEIIEEVILGAIHCEMVVMSRPQSTISHYELDVLLRKYSPSNNFIYGAGKYDSDEGMFSIHEPYIGYTCPQLWFS